VRRRRKRRAALRGSAEIGFTILSISLSLVAVFIPLFLMPGIVGRLFREFAVAVTATILVSVIVSLTLAPMLAARLLPATKATPHRSWFYRVSERGFDALQAGSGRLLDIALRHRMVMLTLFAASVLATGLVFMRIPKGFFPQQNTGLILGTIQTSPETSFAEMTRLSLRIATLVQDDPDVATVGLSLGSAAGLTENQGRIFVSLKPRDARNASASAIIRRLAPRLAAVPGARSYLQAVQDLTVGGRLASTQYQYTLQDANPAELDGRSPCRPSRAGPRRRPGRSP